MKNYSNWKNSLKTIQLPRYTDLPDIPLYSDQVLEYTKKVLSPLFYDDSNILTSAMINNYVKNKMMPAPIKKKYSRDHLAYIITITVLKQVINIPDIAYGINAVRVAHKKTLGFDTFISFLESEVRSITHVIVDGEPYERHDLPSSPLLLPMRAATMAFAGKLIAEASLHQIKEQNDGKNRNNN